MRTWLILLILLLISTELFAWGEDAELIIIFPAPSAEYRPMQILIPLGEGMYQQMPVAPATPPPTEEWWD